MLKNYLTVALRNFWRNKIFTLINISGLSIGISASLVIYLIVHYDFSFDRFEKDGDRIFRIVSEYSFQGNTGHNRGTPGPLGDALKREVGGIDETVNFRSYNAEKLAVVGANPSKPLVFKRQPDIIFTDGHYFNLLSYRWLAGSRHSALEEPGRVVLSETRARLYFPSLPYADLIGRKIVYDDSIITIVSGVVQDLSQVGKTDFSSKEFISLPTLLDNSGLRNKFYWDVWGATTSDQQLYVRLTRGATASSVEAKLRTLFNKYLGKDARDNHYKAAFLLQPLNDIHFNSDYGSQASKPTLYGLMLVAVFLLLLGSINFINLTTAQASQRAKEIGIRKTMGSSKGQLVLQFLSETFLTTLFATGLSLALTPLLLKVFVSFIPEGLHFSLREPYLAVFLITLVPAVSMLAGFYPALVLSSWKPMQVLKNQSYSGSAKTRKTWIRQTLTVSQFIIAQAFIMGTLLVGKQIRFMLVKDLGFTKEAIISFGTPSTDTSYSRRLYFLNEVRNIPGINLASLAKDVPSSGGWWTSIVEYKNGKNLVETDVEFKAGDTNYLKLFHIPLVAGRNLLASDTHTEIVINETYLKILGFHHPQEAIGKTLKWDDKNVPIVGVMKDFHAHPLNYKIAPMAFCQSNRDCNDIIVALQPRQGQYLNTSSNLENKAKVSDWRATISKIEKIYKKTYPEEEFSYSFFDESIANAYSGEQNISNLLRWATGLTVFISCLGLLGLVIYTTNRRTKEIGVRKVLGASVTQIVSIISRDFVKLVAIAFIFSAPLAWWALQKWLDNFAFRTSISAWVFVLSGLGMIAIALITISVQTVRAAMANPVKSLRTE
ncbi:MAG TPA: ABC transporter permease [Puia sp.]|nr:ABC transporter permease [Puia sp.]